MITCSNPNSNYLAKIIRVDELHKHPNADKLQIVHVDYQPVITGMNAKVGDLMVYFPLESAIHTDFLKNTNSFRDKTLNADPTQGGFFEHNCRVRAVKLRGQKSCGYLVPLKDVEDFVNVKLCDYVGQYFDIVEGITVCKKYIIKNQHATTAKPKQAKQPKPEDFIQPDQFNFHIDTTNLRKNVHHIQPYSNITITYKLHGTSAIYSKVLCKTRMTLLDRVCKFFGANVTTEKYQPVCASRRVVKSVGGESKTGEHYYKEDIWTTVGKTINLPNGFTVYGEIVGYLPWGGYIQKGYDYGCREKEWKFYVYRVTYTSEQGNVMELSTSSCIQFCHKYNLQYVYVMFQGKASDILPACEHWHENFLKKLEEQYNEKMCWMCNNKVPEEGIVVRVEHEELEVYKLKSFAFFEYETKMLDSGEEINE